jgi:hypothetical protein
VNNFRRDWLIFSVPNERADFRELARLKSTGLTVGVSDMILVTPEKVFFIEVKNAKGKQSEVQEKFQKRVESMGYEYFLVRSLEQFKSYLEQF